MMEKLAAMKQVADESKAKLDLINVEGESGGGLVRIILNGNRKLQSVDINADLSIIQKEDLEDLISVALDRALDAVNKLNESEVMESAKHFFPGV